MMSRELKSIHVMDQFILTNWLFKLMSTLLQLACFLVAIIAHFNFITAPPPPTVFSVGMYFF
jgi:hypothetical protein